MKTLTPNYTLFDHTADLGIKIYGESLERLFKNAAMALMHLMVRRETFDDSPLSKRISVSGQDLGDLMVRWLGEILYLLEGEKRVVTDVGIEMVVPYQLEAMIHSIPFDPNRHEILSEIKAVTYHQITVEKKGGQWEARVIFDL